MPRIQPATLAFLRDLANHNDRDWFQANRPRYEAARANVAQFADALLDRLADSDVLSTASGRSSLFRINRDVRFSNDKSPYKINLAGHFVRDGKLRRGGYYFSLSPTESMVGGGFYGIERDDLQRVREELAADPRPLDKITADPDFTRLLGEMRGDQLKTAPRGFPRDHPSLRWLRYKQFYAGHDFTADEVTAPDFLDRAHDVFLALRPFFDYFSDVLTTDANGELIV